VEWDRQHALEHDTDREQHEVHRGFGLGVADFLAAGEQQSAHARDGFDSECRRMLPIGNILVAVGIANQAGQEQRLGSIGGDYAVDQPGNHLVQWRVAPAVRVLSGEARLEGREEPVVGTPEDRILVGKKAVDTPDRHFGVSDWLEFGTIFELGSSRAQRDSP
jgi:hypothetical protein